MSTFVVLDAGRPTVVDATVENETVRVPAAGIDAAIGWTLEPEGLCRDDVCIPLAGRPGLVSDGAIDLVALADLLGRPLAIDVAGGAAYLGPPLVLHDQMIDSLEAPDFTLPDLDGRLHSLAEHRGSKVLLAVWASW